MTIAFYEHPFSSYVQKAKDGSLRKRHSVRVEDDRWLRAGRQRVRRALADAALPGDCRRRPVRVRGDGHHRISRGARLIPSDLPLAAETRMWDRFFDNYVSYPQGRLVFMAIGREPD